MQIADGVEVPNTDKPRIVVLGSGWGAISFMKALDKQTAAKYDVVLLSPRNYFLYTPLLPAVATGVPALAAGTMARCLHQNHRCGSVCVLRTRTGLIWHSRLPAYAVA